MFDIERARKLLEVAGVFFGNDEEEPALAQTLNMNDVWGWACSDGQFVRDEQLPEVARLFFFYGWAGILYWVSDQNSGMKSEFHDNNRLIEFVREEELRRGKAKAVFDLLDARELLLEDRPHREIGKTRTAKSVRIKPRPRGS